MRSLPRRGGLKRCLNSDQGQTLVETALSISILLGFVFGILVAGMTLYSYNFVAEAARDGSRYAMVHGSSCSGCIATNASVQTYVKGLAYPGIKSADLTAVTTWPDSGASCTPSLSPCNNPGNNVMVVVTYQLPWNFPFISSSTLSLKSTSEVIIAQ
jgi:Flp pilus assembly protein TadG